MTQSGDRTSGLDLTSASWAPGERESFLAQQVATRTVAGTASGTNGAVTVAYGAYAARAGLEALKQGGNAIDAALTTATSQIALTAGAPISYFGILSLVYFDAKTGQVHTMNAEWNTVAGETDAQSIPGAVAFGSDEAVLGSEPSGRTALVGGFMKGVEAAHSRFGKLPFGALFQPAIELAETGIPVNASLAWCYTLRTKDLARLSETAETLLKPDGSGYAEGETLLQPKLAETLRRVAADGADYMYGGPWGERLVAAVQADGGHMTLEDLTSYEVIWSDAIVADIGDGYSIATAPWPNGGGIAMIEAQNVADVAGLTNAPHWTKSAASLRTALDISQLLFLAYLPQAAVEAVFPGLDFSPENRVTRAHAEQLWARIKDGNPVANWKRNSPMHSDDVVAIDAEGNIAAITHSINCVLWGKTGITIDGISIGDPASFQQATVAATGPGKRLPAPTETGILLKDDVPVVGFASMGAGLHQRTFQGLLNYRSFEMSVEDAINTPDFFLPETDPTTGELTVTVPAGRFDPEVLNATGLQWNEVGSDQARLGGEGYWVAIERDPGTGQLSAGSHNRNNSAAVAY
jgi:gamma-glutamyltranspeptidase / glutathione hydrolase